jgi:hypothetical protein
MLQVAQTDGDSFHSGRCAKTPIPTKSIMMGKAPWPPGHPALLDQGLFLWSDANKPQVISEEI